ncbi:hypothetical protein HYC85_004791 [Camellia sinensis]|uniref:Ninja-family protein n=1 Tax=Camellia sinensis TaxID=4442 RepID=A0A7J7HZG2_CAMSI|nr:hypothetical protein HYC85_004791 [Camellia sinensis]
MGEAQNNHITPQKNGHPRDLMQRFRPGNYFPRKLTADEEEEEEEEEIELSLGLSLNGRFGIDPKRANTMLTRSSSISDFMLTTTTTTDHNNTKAARVAEGMAYAPLIRTCSLPTETEEEWRKRKEIQSMRRMEAKRKRLEKMKNVRTTVVRDQVGIMISGVEANGEEENVVSQGPVAVKGSTRGGGADGLPPQPSSQGSIGSRGSGSSGISESETQPTHPQGMNICTEDRSPTNDQSLPMQNEQKPVVTAPGTATGKSVNLVTENNKAITRNMMADMPCVSTRGVGPNGKRIEGFLYRYRKGEEVRIVCVCHGSFLTPAEFVKHAGGDDVDHPLKHIVVSPSPLL